MFKHARSIAVASTVIASLTFAGGALAGWEPANAVDNQDSTAGAAGNYAAVADGAGGLSSAFFEQTVGGKNGYYAIRRGASDASWSAPAADTFPNGQSIGAAQPLSAAADSTGNALAVNAQVANGFGAIFASSWPAGNPAPAAFGPLMSTKPGAGGLTDPQVAFDGAGNGYAVAGEGQGASLDEPILISTYSPAAGTWSAPSPVSLANPGTTVTCSNGAITTKGEVCGQEPRIAVSPDGTVVVAYLVTVPGSLPTTTQEELFAARATAGTVAASGGSAFSAVAQISQPGDQIPVTSYPGGSPSATPPNFDLAVDGADTATIGDAESQLGGDTQVLATQWGPGPTGLHGASQISSANPPVGATEPRVVADAGGDVTAVWTESSSSSPPPADALVSSEITGGHWTKPETVTGSADSPTNPQGYAVNTPPFSVAEDPAGSAWLLWTDGGALRSSVRQQAKAWSAPATISGVSGAVPGTARIAAGLAGQADALVIASTGSRNALYASRFAAPAPLPPPAPSAPAPVAGPPATGTKPVVSRRRPKACPARPSSRILRARAQRGTLTASGVAGERRCADASAADARRNHVRVVYVMVYRPLPNSRCRFLLTAGRLSAPRPCSDPVEFRARGTAAWTLRRALRVPAGSYLVRSDAVDGFGRHQRRRAASVRRIVVRPARPRRAGTHAR